MADRRMFTKKVTDSDAFVEMPSATQALYFHLNQSADDDGFNNQIQIAMLKAHAGIDDLKILMMKRFVIRFESGVIVIKHWRMHNTLRKDRYTPTAFQEELAQLGIKDNQSYTLLESGCQVVAERLPDGCPSIGKVSIGKFSLGEESENKTAANAPYSSIVEMFNSICVSYSHADRLSDARRKAIKARLGSYSVDDFKTLFEKAESSRFLKGGNRKNWKANFDWLIKDANMAKVLDGNYDNEKDTPQGPDPKAPNEKTRAAVDWLEDFMTGGGA
jgi:hypothetical protein